jgi:hypothetical protein
MIVYLLMVMVKDDCLFVETNSHLSPLPSTNKQSALTITINKQTVISHHYHQQTNNLLTITIKKQTVRDDCLFVEGNGES